MTIIIRIPIQNHKGMGTPQNHVVFPILVALEAGTQETTMVTLGVGGLEIARAPGCPDSAHHACHASRSTFPGDNGSRDPSAFETQLPRADDSAKKRKPHIMISRNSLEYPKLVGFFPPDAPPGPCSDSTTRAKTNPCKHGFVALRPKRDGVVSRPSGETLIIAGRVN